MFPAWSSAVTVKLNDVPAVAEDGAETEKCVAGPALTTIPPLVPVIDGSAVSVPIRCCVPGVFKVAWNEPVPAVSVALAGNVEAPSVEVK
jgi:hypothetical protein